MTRTARASRASLCIFLLLGPSAAGARAQIVSPPGATSVAPTGRVEVGAGIEWVGQASIGTIDATETTPTGSPAVLFSTSSVLAGAVGLHAHIGVRVTNAIEAELVASRTNPQLQTTITNDIEAATPVVATDDITQYVIGGGVLWYLPFRIRSSGLLPFVDGSAAYLRQLHQSNTLVDTGQMYRFDGGVKYFFPRRTSASWLKGYGLRADAGLAVRVKGVAFDSSARYSPAATASIFMRF
jgi:hypothetical protein